MITYVALYFVGCVLTMYLAHVNNTRVTWPVEKLSLSGAIALSLFSFVSATVRLVVLIYTSEWFQRLDTKFKA